MNQDHLWHPNNTAEWWYFTGIGELGAKPANFHLAFFRKFSKTFNKHFWFAHFGFWDGEKFHFERKYDLDHSGDSADGCYVGEWKLHFRKTEIWVEMIGGNLIFTPQKSPIGHDDDYYSITDVCLEAYLFNKSFQGRGWFDHAFFDATVKELLDLKYTWIALQLNNGMEIMVQWSSREPKFLGTAVYSEGNTRKIEESECDLSQHGKRWLLEIAEDDLSFNLNRKVENKINGNPEPGYIEGILDVPGGVGYFEIAEGRQNG